MASKRIEYIDALRGFTMYLVVYSHIWTFGYQTYTNSSFIHILTNFFLEMFFFISGFVAYKDKFDWSFTNTTRLLRTKAIQLLCPTIIFCSLFCWWGGYGVDSAISPSNAGYWFTLHLFYFYVFYSITSLISSKIKGIKFEFILILIALLIYGISYSHEIIEKTQFGADIFHYLGMKNWRYYIFFCLGVFIRINFNAFIKITDQPWWMALFILGFFGMIFYADKITIPMWKPLNMIIYGGLSIVIIFTFFRKYENAFLKTRRLGYVMQYIGKRTMDIYMIHYFLLPRNLNPLGEVLAENPNPSIEFFVTTAIAFMVILLSLIVGNIIRLSPLLSLFLLGEKSQKSQSKCHNLA